MNSYLEDLVIKSDDSEEVTVEPTTDVEPESQAITNGEQVSEPVETAEHEEVAEHEEPVEVEEVTELETVEVEAADIPSEDGHHYNDGDVIAVKDLKVFNVPDTGSPFRIITGNVTFRGAVDNFNMIEYMRYGFGLVVGYTQDLE